MGGDVKQFRRRPWNPERSNGWKEQGRYHLQPIPGSGESVRTRVLCMLEDISQQFC